MGSDLIELLYERKLIRRESYQTEDILRHIERAYHDLKTAEQLLHDDEIAYSIAYQAMLRAGRALMFQAGYRPVDGQQHMTVVRFAEYVLGDQAGRLIDSFERMRRQRHTFWYESIEVISRTDAVRAIEQARMFVELSDKYIREKRSEKQVGRKE